MSRGMHLVPEAEVAGEADLSNVHNHADGAECRCPTECVEHLFAMVCEECGYVLPSWEVTKQVVRAHRHCGVFRPMTAAELEALGG